MKNEKPFVLDFNEIGIKDVPVVGGKNAALGEMYSRLVPEGINVPGGFAVTAEAYRHILKTTGLDKNIKGILKGLDTRKIGELKKRGKEIRRLIMRAKMPREIREEIKSSYKNLSEKYGKNISVAVRSSATAEDLPGASFAGQQETYLNVSGASYVVEAVRRCMASLFTDRAISYRVHKGFSNSDVAISVGVQKMVRSDIASSGVAFTIDTESGFEKVIVINSIYGLGEMIVQGEVIPDEFVLFKPSLEGGFNPVISKKLGRKDIKLVYSTFGGTKRIKVGESARDKFSITDEEAVKLGEWCMKIERHFSKERGCFQPMDIEWAKDGTTGELFIVQARPETVAAARDKNTYTEYEIKEKGKMILAGISVGSKIGVGKVRIVKNARGVAEFKKGEVLVAPITDPDLEPIMKIASAIITDNGGRTSHAAIVSRELGTPCIVGTKNATRELKNGMFVTVSCAEGDVGRVYEGEMGFSVKEHKLDKIPETKTKIMANIGSPDEAFGYHNLPVSGVGLGRLEFIIASHIKIHPNALIKYKELKHGAAHLKDKREKNRILKIIGAIDAETRGYEDKKKFYSDKLAEGIAKIAAAFSPNDAIIRLSDFKTNEYRQLIGGELYEPEEENPMLGWRGASRYYDPKFKEAFSLECEAFRKVRSEIGMKNVIPMVPFCRTPEEGRKVLEVMEEYGLSRKSDKTLKVYVMCEIPSNVLLADEFLKIFDGMSIGSNDLAQLTLGIDRDSALVAGIADERNDAVKKLIAEAVKKCKRKKKYIGICGQAPSDYFEFAEFLVQEGIMSISLSPDSVIKTILRLAGKENG